MYKFKLVRGVHQEDGVTYVSGPDGPNIIETEKNLLLQNNPNGIRPRFVQIDRFAPISQDPRVPREEGDDLDGKTVPQLRKIAEQDQIDLGTATKRDEILSIIRGELQLQ